MKQTLVNGKWNIILPDHRADRPEWVTGWEVETLDALHRNITKDDLVYEVGAEEGDMSGLIAQWCEGRIVLFEPNPKVWPNIKAIWEANNIPGPLGYFVGFAGTQDIAVPNNLNFELGTDGKWPKCAAGPLIGDHGFRNLAEEADSTPQTTIDLLVHDTGLVPTVITMDIEGAEFEALMGAKDTLEKHHPLVFVSVHAAFMYHYYKQDPTDFMNWMMKRGYKYHLLAWDHEIHVVFHHPEGKKYVA